MPRGAHWANDADQSLRPSVFSSVSVSVPVFLVIADCTRCGCSNSCVAYIAHVFTALPFRLRTDINVPAATVQYTVVENATIKRIVA